jgi:hypothetical protein
MQSQVIPYESFETSRNVGSLDFKSNPGLWSLSRKRMGQGDLEVATASHGPAESTATKLVLDFSMLVCRKRKSTTCTFVLVMRSWTSRLRRGFCFGSYGDIQASTDSEVNPEFRFQERHGPKPQGRNQNSRPPVEKGQAGTQRVQYAKDGGVAIMATRVSMFAITIPNAATTPFGSKAQ